MRMERHRREKRRRALAILNGEDPNVERSSTTTTIESFDSTDAIVDEVLDSMPAPVTLVPVSGVSGGDGGGATGGGGGSDGGSGTGAGTMRGSSSSSSRRSGVDGVGVVEGAVDAVVTAMARASTSPSAEEPRPVSPARPRHAAGTTAAALLAPLSEAPARHPIAAVPSGVTLSSVTNLNPRRGSQELQLEDYQSTPTRPVRIAPLPQRRST
jgi:hypothetical protein